MEIRDYIDIFQAVKIMNATTVAWFEFCVAGYESSKKGVVKYPSPDEYCRVVEWHQKSYSKVFDLITPETDKRFVDIIMNLRSVSLSWIVSCSTVYIKKCTFASHSLCLAEMRLFRKELKLLQELMINEFEKKNDSLLNANIQDFKENQSDIEISSEDFGECISMQRRNEGLSRAMYTVFQTHSKKILELIHRVKQL